jgi:hypothetical protein
MDVVVAILMTPISPIFLTPLEASRGEARCFAGCISRYTLSENELDEDETIIRPAQA